MVAGGFIFVFSTIPHTKRQTKMFFRKFVLKYATVGVYATKVFGHTGWHQSWVYLEKVVPVAIQIQRVGNWKDR